METSGPAVAREATGPLRRLITGPGRALPPPSGIFFRYGVPLGLLALLGLATANQRYLQDNRSMNVLAAVLLSLPVLIAGWVAQNKLVRGLSMGAVK